MEMARISGYCNMAIDCYYYFSSQNVVASILTYYMRIANRSC